MANRVDEIRRKIQARRRKISSEIGRKERSQPQYYPSHSESRDDTDYYFPSSAKGAGEPEEKLFRKDILMFQILTAVCLFLIVGILFRTQIPQLEGARQFVKNSFEQEFQFATVANWYEDQFGKPLALLPTTRDVALENLEGEELNVAYAVPATGRVTKSFDQDGKGVIIETVSNSNVEAAKSGMVRFVAEEETLGKTVIIAHYDGGESWYAMLDKVEVNLYDHIEAGKKIGTVSLNDNKGFYYFALKEGETFINPLEVISFD
ncbi:M23 family metallopeptidase [Anaerobacillus sp. CMMVII]|uniref:M23 family metallopeptidase n=1 Tax=Anaerobacillus sp. CMMVII TaxID=2755588 RepID=UPI0021B6F22D|nr:M23 family metallopeptidase [Anaerobacillus sp. CMMVII]MCT8137523.1 M23 family metallopeptidase [Anaerobacillus sp. CMMVII]